MGNGGCGRTGAGAAGGGGEGKVENRDKTLFFSLPYFFLRIIRNYESMLPEDQIRLLSFIYSRISTYIKIYYFFLTMTVYHIFIIYVTKFQFAIGID